MTGVQALERAHPEHPTAPGQDRLIEYEYIRHGTLAFIVSFNVSHGGVIFVTSGPTRTEQDYVTHIRLLIAAHQKSNAGTLSSTISIFIVRKPWFVLSLRNPI